MRWPRCARWSASCAATSPPTWRPTRRSPTSGGSPASSAPARPSTWSCAATSTTFRPLSAPRSTAWPRSRSPTPVATRATPPASRSASRPTTRPCACGSATMARPAPPVRPARPVSACVGMMRARRPARRHLRGRPRSRPRMDRHGRASARGGRRVTVRVLVADDQEIVRTGLTIILNTQPGIEVVGEAGDGRAGGRTRPAAPARRVPVRHSDAGHGRHRGHPGARRANGPGAARGGRHHDLRPRRVRVRARCGRAPAASCSRRPAPTCSARPCTPPPTGTR